MFMLRIRTGVVASLMLLVILAACGTADPAPIETVVIEQVQEQPAAEALPETEAQLTPDAEVEESPGSAGVLVFQITSDGSEARFIIDEILRGEPKTVVGATSQVSGEIRIDLGNLSATEVGSIEIEAGTVKTDNNFRNGAIENFILQTGSFPIISFSPAVIDGLPAEVVVGDTFSFTLTGDLTIREITQSVSFDVTVTAQSETEIRGSARTTVLREDFNLTIPSVAQVAGVSNEVILELDFVATR
jgi:polyisoprenoid-binding protein YceI